MKEQYILCLDGLRGWAAIYVMLFHYTFNLFPSIAIVTNGYLAVDLFFVLSGFVMMMVYGISDFNFSHYKRFLKHRFARIYPTYFFWLVICLIVFFYCGFSTKTILTNLLLIQNITMSPSALGTSWSLSVEIVLYICFPVLLWIVKKFSPQVVCMSAITGLCAVAYVDLPLIYDEIRWNGILDVSSCKGLGSLLRGGCGFVLGMLSYKISQMLKQKNEMILNAFLYGVFLLIWILIQLKDFDVVLVGLFSALVALLPTVTAKKNLIVRILSNKLSVFLGKISYALYLCHLVVFWYIIDRYEYFVVNSFTSLLSAILLSMVFATLSYRYIELPTRKKLRKILD